MSSRILLAKQWLLKNENEESNKDSTTSIAENQECSKTDFLKKRFPSFSYKKPIISSLHPSDRFSPLQHFVPGWKGESLSSKNILKFNLILDKIQIDIKNQLYKTKEFPRSIKIGLFNEFLAYAEGQGLQFNGVEDITSFWSLIDKEKLKQNPKVLEFIEIYSNRVATVTFLKLRFISAILEKSSIPFQEKILLYPNSFLTQVFKKGSLTELNCRSLESNIYSWYVPNENLKLELKEILDLSRELTIAEIIKNISARTQVANDQSKIYSHALSHVSVGLFLNSLQVNLPLWLDALEDKTLPASGINKERIISCKYFGDYLESLSLSHWLAQENNQHFRWDEILCSDFKGLEFVTGSFAKICNELQLLTFLVHKAENQGHKPVDYICKIMGGHFKNRKNEQSRNNSLLEDSPFYHSSYDRVVLNLCHFPKNNPQHFLMTQILDQVKFLKNQGYLYVISSKKLFLPSLRERLELLLKELKIEAIFDLENLKGKGELGAYIYVFKKVQNSSSEKQQCLYFRISANLNSFHDFSPITDHLSSFYLNHNSQLPPLAQLEFADGFRIEFIQEAVVNGMLIHSTSEDSTRITHPTFFKGLLDNCITLDKIFEIRPLNSDFDSTNKENYLNLGLKKDLSYFLVVDLRSGSVNLELHPLDTYRSILSDYGQTQCSYFQLIPKISGFNPNLLRNYFLTPVGKQVANLTLSGGLTLIKGSLTKFLVPKFLTQTEPLPSESASSFKILDLDENQLLAMDPESISKSFAHLDQMAKHFFPRFAFDVLSRFSNFERTLQKLIWKLEGERIDSNVSFLNPIVQEQLVKKPTLPIYPSNEDIFIEFLARPSDLHKSMTQCKIKSTLDGGIKLHSLEIYSGHDIIIKLHSDELMIHFLHFILAHGSGIPISKLIKNIYVPSLQDLKIIVQNTENLKVVYSELLGQVQNSIFNAFRLYLIPKRLP